MNQQITLQNRSIQAPTGSGVDYDEDFDGDNIVWALVETVEGETIFDSTNIEQVVTHHFYIRFVQGVTSETWVDYQSVKYDILDVENLDERDEWLLLRTNSRGDNTVSVNKS
jgi:SPP1 family predicted phage head-tail adaptor